jgi:hypothetical protein
LQAEPDIGLISVQTEFKATRHHRDRIGAFPLMETKMNTFTKTLVGAALLAGSVLTVSAPANAQPAYRGDGFTRSYDGDGYGRHDNAPTAAARSGATRVIARHLFGQWRYDTLMHRRSVPIVGRCAADICGTACTQSRSGSVWYRF